MLFDKVNVLFVAHRPSHVLLAHGLATFLKDTWPPGNCIFNTFLMAPVELKGAPIVREDLWDGLYFVQLPWSAYFFYDPRRWLRKTRVTRQELGHLKELLLAIRPEVLVVFADNEVYTQFLITLVRQKMKNRSNVILIEEGIGLYNNRRKLSTDFLLCSGLIKTVILKIIYGFWYRRIDLGYNPNVDIILCRSPEKLPILKKRNKTVLRTDIEELFSSGLEIVSAQVRDRIEQSFPSRTPYFLFLSQPLVEAACADERELVSFIQKLYNVVSSVGLQLVIKPHPGELYDFIGHIPGPTVLHDLKLVPFEAIAPYIEPVAVGTWMSSSALNCRGRKYFMMDSLLYDTRLQNRPDVVKTLTEGNEGYANLSFPVSWESFRDELQRLCETDPQLNLALSR